MFKLKKKWLVLLGIFIWISGFSVFLYRIYHFPPANQSIEAIIILTGGDQRIFRGVDLMDSNKTINGKPTPTLISGVYNLKHVREVSKFVHYKDKIDIGYEATTTRGNAHEVKKWSRTKDLKHIHVVTSHYHMDRSLLELRDAMPNMTFYPFPVISPQFSELRWLARPRNWNLLFKEYNKFLIIYVEKRIKRIIHDTLSLF